MRKHSSLRYLPYFIMSYMLMAFIWWAILLHDKNEQVYTAKNRILELRKDLHKAETAETSKMESESFLEQLELIRQEKERQNRMVFGEVLVFSFALILGTWLISRAHRREVAVANQQKNFLLSITHELKSPLAGIKLALETFLRRELSTEQIQKLSKSAMTETNRLNELVNDLLLSARLESAYTPEFQMIHIQPIIKNICDDFSDKYSDVQLNCNSEEELPRIKIDLQGIKIVLINLLENSIKYNFSKTKKIDLKATRKGKFVSLKIADNGSGISDADKKKVFEKFYRSGNEETRKTKGTGLGLYIVREIVKAHHGKVYIENNHPTGTVFHIELPA